MRISVSTGRTLARPALPRGKHVSLRHLLNRAPQGFNVNLAHAQHGCHGRL